MNEPADTGGRKFKSDTEADDELVTCDGRRQLDDARLVVLETDSHSLKDFVQG